MHAWVLSEEAPPPGPKPVLSASHVCLVLALLDAHSQLWFIFSVRNIPAAGAWGRNAPGSSGMNNWREEDPSSWRINKCIRQAPERINTASKVPGSSCAGILFSQLGMKWHTQVQWGGAGCTVPSVPRQLQRLHCPASDTSLGSSTDSHSCTEPSPCLPSLEE